MCWVAQGPIAEVSACRCTYVLYLGCFSELGPVSHSVGGTGFLGRTGCKTLWALRLVVCTLAAPCSSRPGWGFAALL